MPGVPAGVERQRRLPYIRRTRIITAQDGYPASLSFLFRIMARERIYSLIMDRPLDSPFDMSALGRARSPTRVYFGCSLIRFMRLSLSPPRDAERDKESIKPRLKLIFVI